MMILNKSGQTYFALKSRFTFSFIFLPFFAGKLVNWQRGKNSKKTKENPNKFGALKTRNVRRRSLHRRLQVLRHAHGRPTIRQVLQRNHWPKRFREIEHIGFDLFRFRDYEFITSASSQKKGKKFFFSKTCLIVRGNEMEEKKFPRNLVLFSCENESERVCVCSFRSLFRSISISID